MKLLSDLESLDNVKDGSTRKLNNIEVAESTNLDPFIFTGKQPGMYSLTGDYDTHYFKGSSDDVASLNIYSDTLFITADYASASNNDVIGYIENTRMVSTSLMTYTIEILKDTSEDEGISLGASTTNTIAQGLDISGQDQTISGIKTFSSLPVSNGTPTSSGQLVNKQFIDDNLKVYPIELYTSSSDPLTIADKKVGLYMNTLAYNNTYPLYLRYDNTYSGYESFSTYNAYFQYLVITKDPTTAEDNDTIGMICQTDYTTNPSTYSNTMKEIRIYRYTIKKNSSRDSGLTVNSAYNSYQCACVVPAVYSNTGNATVAKKGYCSLSSIPNNSYIYVNIASLNSVKGAITLNISSTGAKPIYINGEPSSATNYTLPIGSYMVYYDGTNYYFNTDGTIPKVIHGDDSIKRIVEINYEDYQDLVTNNTVDPKTEYHIPESGSGGSIETIVRQLIQEDAERKHPIGSLEFNVSGTNPNSYLGFGTWELWGAGKVPVGIDTTDTDFNTSEKSGGAKTASTSYTPAGVNSGASVSAHTYTPQGVNTGAAVNAHTYTPAGTNKNGSVTLNSVTLSHSGGAVQSHTLTTTEIPSHSHTFPMTPYHYDPVWVAGGVQRFFYDVDTMSASDSYTYSAMASAGGGGGHSHGFTQPSQHTFTPSVNTFTQPTFTGTQATLSHTVTNPTFTGTQATLSHTVTNPTFSGTAATITESTVQPYITCYMWKRTA